MLICPSTATYPQIALPGASRLRPVEQENVMKWPEQAKAYSKCEVRPGYGHWIVVRPTDRHPGLPDAMPSRRVSDRTQKPPDPLQGLLCCIPSLMGLHIL